MVKKFCLTLFILTTNLGLIACQTNGDSSGNYIGKGNDPANKGDSGGKGM